MVYATLTTGGRVDKPDKYLSLEHSPTHPNLYNVVWRGGPGKVPNVLEGTWTKRTGLQAIQNYVEKK